MDFANTELTALALHFFDNPRDYEAFLDQNRMQEAPWEDDARSPSPGELAFEVFFNVLISKSHIGYVDWSSGTDEIVQVFNRLFSKAGVASLAEVEQDEFFHATADCGRGGAFPKLVPHLARAADRRGRKVVYFDMGSDANFPALLSLQAYERWRKAKFAEGFPVVP